MFNGHDEQYIFVYVHTYTGLHKMMFNEHYYIVHVHKIDITM